MRRVILESPYAGDVIQNRKFARACVRDCLKRGESPIASHLLFTQPGILRDHVFAERNLGIKAGLVWCEVADATVVYTDHGITKGMKRGIRRARKFHVPIKYRTLLGNLDGKKSAKKAGPKNRKNKNYR